MRVAVGMEFKVREESDGLWFVAMFVEVYILSEGSRDFLYSRFFF